jgi:RNA recognition motif-containing protein
MLSLFEYSYVGNLDPSVTEELIMVLFGQIGTVKGCKIIHEVKSVQT